jgi:membrane protein YqaA with SNARE-associated domain
MEMNRTALAGAVILNVPTLVAAAFLPATALVVMAVALAVLGASLGALVGWSLQPAAAHTVVELPVYEEVRAAA